MGCVIAGETAYGSFPAKSLETMGQVAQRAEEAMLGQSVSGVLFILELSFNSYHKGCV